MVHVAGQTIRFETAGIYDALDRVVCNKLNRQRQNGDAAVKF